MQSSQEAEPVQTYYCRLIFKDHLTESIQWNVKNKDQSSTYEEKGEKNGREKAEKFKVSFISSILKKLVFLYD